MFFWPFGLAVPGPILHHDTAFVGILSLDTFFFPWIFIDATERSLTPHQALGKERCLDILA